jgi:Xaa-Pro aminopeptidase
MNYYAQRRQTLTQGMKKDGVEGYLITDRLNVSYLTGFTGDSSYLVVTPKTYVLVSDDRFAQQIQEECAGIEPHIRPLDRTIQQATGEVLTKLALKSVAFEGDDVSVGLLETLKEAAAKTTLVAVRGKVEQMRAVKDAMEVEYIRSAVRVAERAFVMFKAMLREADTEKDLVDNMETFVRRAGGTRTAFQPIIAIGERGALPHAPPGDKQLVEGSKLLVDWGAELNGYKSDMTRTFRSPFAVAPSRKNKQERVGFDLEELHAVVLQAQEAALATVRHGVPVREVDAAARQVFANAKVTGGKDINLNDFFTHGLGHGIGLDIHEAPRVRQNSDEVLEAGMVITLEPGLYIPGWGGVRIEDDVLVTRDGATLLTSLPRDLGGLG